jgi:hypothetical protein
MVNYYQNWKETIYTCKVCGWQGAGEQCRQGEMYKDLFEICCPSCGKEIETVMYPTIEESRQNWSKVSETDKKIVELIELRQKNFAASKLKSPDQLPDVEGDDLIFTWDIEDCQKGGDTLIKYGSEIIWREPAFYEGYQRFEEVANIIKQKYGNRLQDLVPTRKSYIYLFGDRLSAPDQVEKVRKSLSKLV